MPKKKSSQSSTKEQEEFNVDIFIKKLCTDSGVPKNLETVTYYPNVIPDPTKYDIAEQIIPTSSASENYEVTMGVYDAETEQTVNFCTITN